MQGSRPARVGEQIREELSVLLARHVKDPGLGFVTVQWVKVSADLQNARVYYTVLGVAVLAVATAAALRRGPWGVALIGIGRGDLVREQVRRGKSGGDGLVGASPDMYLVRPQDLQPRD